MHPSHSTSSLIAERIEALYGAPLSELKGHVEAESADSMLAALLTMHADLRLTEISIGFQLDRLRHLTHPERDIGPFAVGQIYDCARRLADSVTASEVHAKHVTAVLQSLRRVPAREDPPAPPRSPAAAPASRPARTR